MLEHVLHQPCPVCSHPDKDKIGIEIIENGDLVGIAKKYKLAYAEVQDHAQHMDLEEFITYEETNLEKYEALKEKLKNARNPADIVFLMTLLMKERVLNIIEDETASGLVQLDRLNKAIRENANSIAKLRDSMREGDLKKIENLEDMVGLYRGVMLDLCHDCSAKLDFKIAEAVESIEVIESEMAEIETTEAMDKETLPKIPEPLVG